MFSADTLSNLAFALEE